MNRSITSWYKVTGDRAVKEYKMHINFVACQSILYHYWTHNNISLHFVDYFNIFSYTASAAATGSLTPETLCVSPGDEATFTCSVEGSGGVFTWITNTTTETCLVSSSSPQSQCGQFIGQLQNSSLSTLTAMSSATSDIGNILIQCYYITDLVGNAKLLIAG